MTQWLYFWCEYIGYVCLYFWTKSEFLLIKSCEILTWCYSI
jgi:hypothetical protein